MFVQNSINEDTTTKTKSPKSATTIDNFFCPWQTPSKVSMALKSKKQWEKTPGLIKGLCYTFSVRSFVPFDDARFTDCKIRDTPHRPSDHIRHFLLTIVHAGKPKPKDDKWKRRRKRSYRHKMKFFRKNATSKRKNPIIRTCKAWKMMSISGAYCSFSTPMPSSHLLVWRWWTQGYQLCCNPFLLFMLLLLPQVIGSSDLIHRHVHSPPRPRISRLHPSS
jgi:hypothetical protein